MQKLDLSEIGSHNQSSWDKASERRSPWSQPVTSELIERAKQGQWEVHLTKSPIPKEWFPPSLKGLKVLCLASAGGQQAPVLAAAGAKVTVFDISQNQLNQDRWVANRDGLEMNFIQGDMMDMSSLESNSFDLIFHPISNLYVPDVSTVWKSCFRVLKSGGSLLASFYNPVAFVFDNTQNNESGVLIPKFSIPYSDVVSLSPEQKEARKASHQPFIFGHSLTSLIKGQLEAGFSLVDLFEDHHPSNLFIIDKFLPVFIATNSIKK